MTRGTKAVLGTGVLCLGLAASAVWADRSPLAAQAAPPRPSAGRACAHACLAEGTAHRSRSAHHAAATADSAEHNQVIAKYCAGCHNDRRPAGGLSLVGFDVSKAAEQGRGRREDDPQAAGGDDAAAAARRGRTPATHAALIAALETTLDAAAAAQARIPARRTFQRLNRPEYAARRSSDLLGARGRRRRLAAARHEERELRQHRRRAGAVADAARGVPERRGRRSAAWRSATGNAPAIDHDLHQPELRLAAPVGSRRGRAVRHARRHGRQPRLPGRRRVRVRADVQRRATTRGFEDIDISIDGERVALLEYETGRSWRRRRPRRGADPHRADPRQGRPAPGRRRVRAPHRRARTRI